MPCVTSQSLLQGHRGGNCENNSQVTSTTWASELNYCTIAKETPDKKRHGCNLFQTNVSADDLFDWAEAHIKIARMTLTIKLDRNWSSFQLANSAPPLSVTDSAIAPSARMFESSEARTHAYAQELNVTQTSYKKQHARKPSTGSRTRRQM